MPMRLSTAVSALALLMGAACGTGDPPADSGTATTTTTTASLAAYETEIQRFRADRDALLRSDTGWLTIAGLFFLTQPETTFGSDPLSDIVFPASAPPRAGVFELRDGRVTVRAAPGVTFVLNGKPITTASLRPDGEGEPDRVMLGSLQFWVHTSGDRLSIRLRDQEHELRRTFTGTVWYPVDPEYRVDAVFAPYAAPNTVEMPNILGDIDRMTAPGTVSFTLKGQHVTLEPVVVPDGRFWFIFRDLTSQDDTYPAARFLYADPPIDRKLVLDFNRTINPPCAYNPYTTCPLPPEHNRLRFRIEAGEKRYH